MAIAQREAITTGNLAEPCPGAWWTGGQSWKPFVHFHTKVKDLKWYLARAVSETDGNGPAGRLSPKANDTHSNSPPNSIRSTIGLLSDNDALGMFYLHRCTPASFLRWSWSTRYGETEYAVPTPTQTEGPKPQVLRLPAPKPGFRKRAAELEFLFQSINQSRLMNM